MPARKGAWRSCLAILFVTTMLLQLSSSDPAIGSFTGTVGSSSEAFLGTDIAANLPGEAIHSLSPPSSPDHPKAGLAAVHTAPDHLADPDGRAPASSRSLTTLKMLTLLINFTDVPQAQGRTEESYNNMLFNGSEGRFSLTKYWDEASRGQLGLNGTVAQWVASNRTMAYYGGDGTGIDDVTGPIYRLVTEAVRKADADINFSEFDTDGDGTVEGLCVIHAGDAQEDLAGGTDPDQIWSHHWAVYDADPDIDGYQTLMADGVRIFDYMMLAETSPVGTFAHEMGHDLGLPDLYDVDGSTYGVGLWDLMGHGSWNMHGTAPAHPSAWSLMALGWVQVDDITTPQYNISLEQVQTSGRILRLWVGDPAKSTEYFLVENRQEVGFDIGLPGNGTLVWHVDTSVLSNTADDHRMVDLLEADELVSGDHPLDPDDAYRSSKRGIDPETVPNTDDYSSRPTGWFVNEIGASAPFMTMTIHDLEDDIMMQDVDVPRYVMKGGQVDIKAYIANDGNKDQGTFPVTMSVTSGATTLFEDVKNVTGLRSRHASSLAWKWNSPDTGTYLVTVCSALPGDMIPSNDCRMGMVRSTEIRFMDTVETGTNGWTHRSEPATVGGNDLWAIATDASSSPTHSWRCAIDRSGTGAGTGFIPGSDQMMERDLDVTNMDAGYIVFQHRYGLQNHLGNVTLPNTDVAHVEVSMNGGVSWDDIMTYTGTQPEWTEATVDITDILGRHMGNTMRLRFRVETGNMFRDKSWYIDDIMLVGAMKRHDMALSWSGSVGGAGKVTIVPGGTVNATLTVVNTGNVYDKFKLISDGPEHWAIVTNTGELALGIGASGALKLLITAPEDAVAGPGNLVSVTVISTGDTKVKATATLAVDVAIKRAMLLDVQGVAKADPGDDATLSVEVRNQGNTPESVALNLSGIHADWADISPVRLDIAAFSNGTATITVHVPEDMAAGEDILLTVKATSASGLMMEDTGNVEVNPVLSFELGMPDGPSELPAGKTTSFNITISNTGNDEGTVKVTLGCPPGLGGCTLDGKSSESVSIGASKDRTALLQLTPGDEARIDTTYSVTITLTYDDEHGKEMELDGTVQVRVVRPDLTIEKVLFTDPTPEAGEVIGISVIVKNNGNAPATAVSLVSYDNNEYFDEQAVDIIQPGQAHEFTLERKMDVGYHTLFFTVSSGEKEGDMNDNQAFEDMRVRSEPKGLPIPGLGPALTVLCFVMAAISVSAASSERRRRGTGGGRGGGKR